MGEGLIEKLTAAGITTVEALADMTPEQLEAIDGIGPKTVEKISLAVNNYFSSLESGEAGPTPEAAQEAPVEEATTDQALPKESDEATGAATGESMETAQPGLLDAAAEEAGSQETQGSGETPAASDDEDK
jgi:N utilization substance protein A